MSTIPFLSCGYEDPSTKHDCMSSSCILYMFFFPHIQHCTSLQASRCMMLGKIQAAEDGLRAKAYVTRTALRPRLRSPIQGAIAKELRQNESRTAPKRRGNSTYFNVFSTCFDPQIYHRFEAKNGMLGIYKWHERKIIFHDRKPSLRAQGILKLHSWNLSLESYGNLVESF